MTCGISSFGEVLLWLTSPWILTFLSSKCWQYDKASLAFLFTNLQCSVPPFRSAKTKDLKHDDQMGRACLPFPPARLLSLGRAQFLEALDQLLALSTWPGTSGQGGSRAGSGGCGDTFQIYLPSKSLKSAHGFHSKNIAKGTTDPRVEFILPK